MNRIAYLLVALLIVVLIAFGLTIVWDAIDAPAFLTPLTYVIAIVLWLFYAVGGRFGTRTRL